MALAANEVVTTIAEIRSLHTSGGKAYWLLKDANRRVFKTWSPAVANVAMENAGQPVRIIYHEDTWQGRSGPMTDYLIDEFDPTPPPASDMPAPGPMATGARADSFAGSSNAPANADEGMTQKGWREKEDRETWRRLYISHLMNLWRDGFDGSYADARKEARNAAFADLEIMNAHVNEEVPF